MKNFLFIGLGSIGQRHLRNIKKLYPRSNIYAFRRLNLSPLLNNKNKFLSGNLEKKYNIIKIENLQNIEKLNLDAAFVCSPTSKHCDDAKILIKKKINTFIEKPIDSNLNKAKNLLKISKKNKITTMVGFNFKFNPLINFIKKFLKSNFLGRLLLVESSLGEHVDDFHSYESYKISYTSIKKLGGGVIFSQIHDLDNIMYLLEGYKFNKSYSFSKKLSKLKLDVEDTLVSIFSLKKNKHKILCSLNLNFYERPKNRKIKLVFENGKLYADFNKNRIQYYLNNKVYIKKFNLDRNDVYLNELKYFFNCIKKKKLVDYPFSIESSIKTLKCSINLKK